MRIKQWYKALIVFSGPLFSTMLLTSLDKTILSFLAFGFIASSIYVINDLKDMEKDKLHPKKKHRPIANGKISHTSAHLFTFLLFSLSIFFASLVNTSVLLLVLSYFALMLLYTFYLKKRPIIDVFVIATGFFIRAFAGCLAISIEITPWFYLVIFSFAIYLAFCKRLTEVKLAKSGHKKNLEVYKHIVEIGIAISGSITLSLYAIYTAIKESSLVWSVPFAFLSLLLHLRETFAGKEVHETLMNPEVLLAGLAFGVAIFLGLY